MQLSLDMRALIVTREDLFM